MCDSPWTILSHWGCMAYVTFRKSRNPKIGRRESYFISVILVSVVSSKPLQKRLVSDLLTTFSTTASILSCQYLVFRMETLIEVRHRNGNQRPYSFFCSYCGWSIFKIKLKILNFRDRFDIPSEMRLSGVAEQEYARLYRKSQFRVRCQLKKWYDIHDRRYE